MRTLNGIVLLLLTCGSFRQAAGATVYNFPALVYGREEWSNVTIANHGGKQLSVRIEAFDEFGKPVVLPRQTDVAPGAVREVRIPFPIQNHSALGWARVTVPRGPGLKEVEVTAAVEHVEHNKLYSVRRLPEEFQKRTGVFLFPEDQSFLYLLNWDDHDVEVTYCWWAGPRRSACPEKNAVISHVRLDRGQALLARVGPTRGRALVLRMNRPTRMMLTGMAAANTTTKDYLSDTKLTFDMSGLDGDGNAPPAPQGR